MPQRERSPVCTDARVGVGDAEPVEHGEGLGGEGLDDLERSDVGDSEPRRAQGRADGGGRADPGQRGVAADDGVRPQTREAVDHAKAAGVPMLVAVNKIDKEGADPMRVRTEMTQLGLQPSDWGGDTEFVDVSAKTKDGLETLLETIQVVADLQEIAANPNAEASGVAIGARSFRARWSCCPARSATAVSMRNERRPNHRCSTPSCSVQAWMRRRATLVRRRASSPRSTISRRASSLSRNPWNCSSASTTDSTRTKPRASSTSAATPAAPASQPRCSCSA